MKKLFRSTYYTGFVAVFLIVAALGFTQTNTFRSYLRALIIESVGEGINGELLVNRLEGNLLTGFWADSVAVVESGVPVLFIDRIEARYDPLSIFVKRVSLSHVKLVRPVFSLRRSSDSVWNTARLFKPASPDSTPSSWVIIVKQVEMQGGTFSILDSAALRQRKGNSAPHPSNEFDFANLSLGDLALDAGIRIGDGTLSGIIRSLSFASSAPNFRLEKLSGDLFFSPTEASVRSLDIKTERSFLRVSARVQNANVAAVDDLRDLQDAPLSVNLKLNALDLAELKQIVGSPLSFLDRSVKCDLEVEGTFNALELTSFHLQNAG